MRVLIVDGCCRMRVLLSGIMTDLGFDVVEVDSARAALEQAGTGAAFHLALVNWTMPEMDGLALVGALRSLPAGSAIKIMMVTGHDDLTKIARAAVDRAGDTCLGPLTRAALIPKLQTLGLVGV